MITVFFIFFPADILGSQIIFTRVKNNLILGLLEKILHIRISSALLDFEASIMVYWYQIKCMELNTMNIGKLSQISINQVSCWIKEKFFRQRWQHNKKFEEKMNHLLIFCCVINSLCPKSADNYVFKLKIEFFL